MMGIVSRDQNPLGMSSTSSSVPGTPPPTGTIASSGSAPIGMSSTPLSLPGSTVGTVNSMKGTSTTPGVTNSNANAYLNREEVREQLRHLLCN